jgi:hypothetical protein
MVGEVSSHPSIDFAMSEIPTGAFCRSPVGLHGIGNRRYKSDGAKHAADALIGSKGQAVSRGRYTLMDDFPTTDVANFYGD